MNEMARQRIIDFLGCTPVPFSGSPQWEWWQEECNRLVGAGGVRVLVDILKMEPESLHYGAMMALRMLGVQVGQTGEGTQTIYEIHSVDGSRDEKFSPAHPPKSYGNIDDIDGDRDWITRIRAP